MHTTRPIRTSAKAIILRDGKLLTLRLEDSDGTYYILPGGGQQGGELLPEALCREVQEETGLQAACGPLLFVIEGSQGEPFHRVDVVFAATVADSPAAMPLHPDAGQKGVAWLDVATLNTQPLYPSRLRRAIMGYAGGETVPAYLGNECIGDPEITD